MASGDWQKIEELYLDVSSLPEADRPTFLDKACADDPALRAQVESMLYADTTSPRFLGSAPSRPAPGQFSRRPGALVPGDRVGDYEVRSLLSVGGMGEVYQAEHVHSHQLAALKLIRRHLMEDVHAVDSNRIDLSVHAHGPKDAARTR